MSDGINYEPDIIYKFILIGDTNVGKTCIFKKLSCSKFEKNNLPTVGLDYQPLNYVIEIEENSQKIKKKIKIKLFDTAGQERFRSFTKSFVNNSNGIIIVYDITERKSFEDVKVWVRSIEDEFGKCEDMKACMFLIGNKKDLVEGEEGEKERKVQINEAKILAEKYNLIWAGECSAKDFPKDKFDEIFINFAKTIYSKYKPEKKDKDKGKGNINLNERNEIRRERNCAC